MKKLICSLFLSYCTVLCFAQSEGYEFWEKLKLDDSMTVAQLVDIHKRNESEIKNNITDKEALDFALLRNDVYAIITLGRYIDNDVKKKPDPKEKYFFSLVKKTDISTENFAKLFSGNGYLLKYYFYVKYLSEKAPRTLAMGSDYNNHPDDYYEAIYYDYKRVIDVLENCHVSLREECCNRLIGGRSDHSEYQKLLKPVIERQLPESDYKKTVLDRISLLEPLAKGNPSPKWEFEDRKGEMYSLDDFRGKFLVIDMWATWCGGCIANLPYFLEVSNKFADRDDIRFITISIDVKDKYYDWKYSLARHNLMRMMNLISYGDDFFLKNFHFTGVPRYMIIDPEGKIVTTAAPSPSSKSFERLISKTLNEYKKNEKK